LSFIILGVCFCIGCSGEKTEKEINFDSFSSPTPIQLIKKEEIYLRGVTYNKEKGEYLDPRFFTANPRFVVTKNGWIVFKAWDYIYSFDEKQNLFKRYRCSGNAPGRFQSVCSAITLSDKNEIVAIDLKKRVNIFNEKIELNKSMIIPDFVSVFDFSRVFENYLIASGIKFNFTSGETEKWQGISVFDHTSGKNVAHFFETDGQDLEMIYRKKSRPLFRVYFDISQKGHLLCNRMSDHRIYEYDLQGNLIHMYDQLPEHYVPLSSASSYEISNSTNGGGIKSLAKGIWEWGSTWSPSGCPNLYQEDMFIVPRRNSAPFYLDFYSTSKKNYIGFYESDKPFLFSDLYSIYLCEDFNDSVLVVGKYEAMIGKEAPPQPIAIEEVPIEIRDKWREEMIEVRKAISLNSIQPFAIKNLEGRDQPLQSFLSSNSHHLLYFVKPFDCAPNLYLQEAEEFILNNQEFDLWVIVNHPFREELRLFLNGWDVEVLTLPNLAVKRLRKLDLAYTPKLVVVDRQGKIHKRISPFEFETPTSFTEFLNRMKDDFQQ
jgi:hypothetical protein